MSVDYAVGSNLGRIASALQDLARAQGEIAKAMAETNKIELAKQKREWLRDGLHADTFNVGSK